MQQFISHLNSFFFGRFSHQKDGTFGPIKGPYFALIYVESGACNVVFDNQESTIKAGKCGIFASQKYFMYSHPHHKYNSIVACEGHFGRMGLRKFQTISGIGEVIPISNALKSLLDIGLSLSENFNSNVRLVAKSKKALFNTGVTRNRNSTYGIKEFQTAIGHACMRAHFFELNKNKEDNRYPNFLLLAKDYIDGNFTDENLKINSLSKKVSISEQHLINAFKKKVGMTPSRYIWNKRLNYAKRLLLETNLSQQEIAFESGFKSTPHFCRQIKKYFEKTPNEIRHS